jgi:glycosyltransferase involved in cell wall biosynthesis
VDVSILLATMGRPALLARTLDSLRALRTDGLAHEIVVVDNGRAPETAALVDGAREALPVRRLVEPARGKNRALNRALPELRGALAVFTDDDVIADRDWLVELVEGARRWPDHRIFGGRVLPLWPAEGGPPYQHEFMRHAYAIADLDRPEGPYDAGWVFGPNFAIHTELLQAGWRFDPTVGPDGTDAYRTGGETELLLRLSRAGYPPIYLPRARVRHQVRPEQLRTTWLYGRAFRQGRSQWARSSAAPGPRLLGVPRPLLARLIRTYAMFLASRLAKDPATRFDRGVSYWRTRGALHESRRARIAAPGGTGGR